MGLILADCLSGVLNRCQPLKVDCFISIGINNRFCVNQTVRKLLTTTSTRFENIYCRHTLEVVTDYNRYPAKRILHNLLLLFLSLNRQKREIHNCNVQTISFVFHFNPRFSQTHHTCHTNLELHTVGCLEEPICRGLFTQLNA